jgi:hypothetical protein
MLELLGEEIIARKGLDRINRDILHLKKHRYFEFRESI